MKSKVLGIYGFKSQKGSDLVKVTLEDTLAPKDSFGKCCQVVLLNRDRVIQPLDSYINKTVVIDISNGFGQSIDEVK